MSPNLLLKGIAIILAIQWVSVTTLNMLGSKFPAPLLGMIVFSILLYTKVISKESVNSICLVLIEKMGMLFLPASVGIILYLQIIKDESIAIFATIIISSLVVLLTTAAFLEFALGRRNKKGGE